MTGDGAFPGGSTGRRRVLLATVTLRSVLAVLVLVPAALVVGGATVGPSVGRGLGCMHRSVGRRPLPRGRATPRGREPPDPRVGLRHVDAPPVVGPCHSVGHLRRRYAPAGLRGRTGDGNGLHDRGEHRARHLLGAGRLQLPRRVRGRDQRVPVQCGLGQWYRDRRLRRGDAVLPAGGHHRRTRPVPGPLRRFRHRHRCLPDRRRLQSRFR